MGVITNTYPEAFKISLVRRYLNGELQKNLCKEFNIAKSTFWGWTCKYEKLILKEREISSKIDVSEDSCFVDIRRACTSNIKSSVIQDSKDTVRIFLDGYAIICNIANLKDVLKVINND